MTRLLVGLCLTVLAAAATAHPAVEAFSRDLRNLQGRFEQRVTDAQGQLREQSRGAVALATPRLFRWDYEEPFPQTIVADGNRVWVYDPDLEQVTVRQQSHEEQSSPLAALIDPAVLEQQFKVSDAGTEGELVWIRLQPRKQDDAAFSEARLGFRGNQLLRMELTDALQQRTLIEFSDWTRNGDIPAQRFRFVPPAGVDVVGDAGAEADVYPLDSQ